MRDRQIQAIVGVIFIASHLLVLATVMVMYILRGFTFEETTTTVAIVAPIFAGYTLIIIRAIVAERNITAATGRGRRQSGLFAFVSLFVPCCFVAALVSIIVLRAYNLGITSFDQFKVMLAVVEGVFAVYLGPIVQSLFSAGEASPNPSRRI